VVLPNLKYNPAGSVPEKKITYKKKETKII